MYLKGAKELGSFGGWSALPDSIHQNHLGREGLR